MNYSQDALRHSAVLVQLYSAGATATTRHIAFPRPEGVAGGVAGELLDRLAGAGLELTRTCGYITLLSWAGQQAGRDPSPAPASQQVDLQLLGEELDMIDSPMAGAGAGRPSQLPLTAISSPDTVRGSDEPHHWRLLDLHYGVPLFDTDLNRAVVERLVAVAGAEAEVGVGLNGGREPGLLEFIKQHSSDSRLTRLDENQVPHSLTDNKYTTLLRLIRRCPTRPSRSGLTGR